jgi:hypothetical protein
LMHRLLQGCEQVRLRRFGRQTGVSSVSEWGATFSISQR